MRVHRAGQCGSAIIAGQGRPFGRTAQFFLRAVAQLVVASLATRRRGESGCAANAAWMSVQIAPAQLSHVLLTSLFHEEGRLPTEVAVRIGGMWLLFLT